MVMTLDEVRSKKAWVANELTAALKQQFNLEGLNVANGITNNALGNPDFAVRISDKNNPDSLVGDDIIEFATKKVQELVPGSLPNIVATTIGRAP